MAKDDQGSRYKEGVDFEWVNSNARTKDGGYVKTRRFFTKAEKAARANPKKEAPKAAAAPAKPSKAPAKAAPKKPKANPARQPGGARPTVGAAGGMPAASSGKSPNPAVVGTLGAAALAAGVAAARSGRGNGRAETTRRAADSKAYNPTYRGGAKSPEGFQGRMKTEVAKPAARGGARAIGGNSARRIGGGGKNGMKLPDVLELQFMNKGGVVKKKK